MFILIVVVTLVISILLTLIVLVQNPKGGGLSATFAGSNQIMGVRKTTDFLEKATWTFAMGILFLSIISVAFIGGGDTSDTNINQELEQKIQQELPEMPSNTLPVETGNETQQQEAPEGQ